MPRRRPPAPLTGTLTEASLFASHGADRHHHIGQHRIRGSQAHWQQSHFTPADTIAGTVSISGFTRASNTVAMLTLAYTGEDITAPGTLSVTLAAAGHTATGDLTTRPHPDITASAGANICDRTEQVRDAIVATSAANTDCTNINNLATITSLDLEGTSIATLQSGDFAGMTGLTTFEFATEHPHNTARRYFCRFDGASDVEFDRQHTQPT